MLLTARNIGLAYDGRAILKDVSFTLDSGEQALLLGPSGSGKSSLLNIICGLQTPDAGAVLLDEQPLAGAQADALRKRHMGIVFQTLRLVSALTVRENLLLAQKLQSGGKDTTMVDQTLDQLGIAHRATAKPDALSQGEAQRAAIARAVVVKPAVLLADEPTSALDRDNTRIVAEMLQTAAKASGASLLIATHDDRLSAFFNRTLTLDKGELAA